MLFGRRLWAETRIALFEQSCDIRTPGMHLRDSLGRVSFGRKWLRRQRRQISTRRTSRASAPLVGSELNEDSLAELDAGRIPQLERAAPAQRHHLSLEPRLLRRLRERQAAPAHRAARPAVRADHRRRGRERRVLARAHERARRDGGRRRRSPRLRSCAGEPVQRGARRPRRALHLARGRRGARAAAHPRSPAAALQGRARSRRREPERFLALSLDHREARAQLAHRLALDAPVAPGHGQRGHDRHARRRAGGRDDLPPEDRGRRRRLGAGPARGERRDAQRRSPRLAAHERRPRDRATG